MQQHGLTPAQIGYRRTLESGYRALRAQEFAEDPELCFLTTGECCFDTESLHRRLREAGEPALTRLSGALRIWFPPMPDTEYLVAVDPAGGGPDGDFAAIQVIDLRTGAQCAELQQRIAPLELSRQAAELGREYRSGIHPALIAVERNNHGHAVLAHLRDARYHTSMSSAASWGGSPTQLPSPRWSATWAPCWSPDPTSSAAARCSKSAAPSSPAPAAEPAQPAAHTTTW
jgi:hypothetical protein